MALEEVELVVEVKVEVSLTCCLGVVVVNNRVATTAFMPWTG